MSLSPKPKTNPRELDFLHGWLLLFTVVAAFLALSPVIARLNLIQFSADFNKNLYLVGVVVGMLWIRHGLPGWREKLETLTLWESIRLSGNQVTRLIAVIFTLAFVTRDSDVSRLFLITFVGVTAVLLILANLAYPRLLRKMCFQKSKLRTVLVGSASEAAELQKWLGTQLHSRVELVGYISESGQMDHTVTSLPRLGDIDEFHSAMIEHNAEQVFIDHVSYVGEKADRLSAKAETLGCRVRFYINAARFATIPTIGVAYPAQYIFTKINEAPLDLPVNQVLKRACDIAISLVMVGTVLPVLTLIVWLVQKWQSPGPVFHRQLRSGLNREKFTIFKFRTMHVAHRGGMESKQATRNDSRIYAFGSFLRRTSLDEMPQFINVLLGEMSVSGPRPHMVEHDHEFAKVVGSYYKRNFVKPGITGLAQTRGLRGEIHQVSMLKERIEYDVTYVHRWSVRLDLRIMLDTARHVVFPPRSAY